MRRIKLGLVIAFSTVSLLLVVAVAQKSSRQPSRTVSAVYRENNCVICHASLVEPVGVSAHFYEWRNSKHEKRGVSCEKCHGGDPTSKSLTTAHEGVLAPTFAQSKLHPKNLATTCSACHQDVVNAFVKSTHYQKLQESNAAPSCTNCHHHMATSVITWPPDTAALCAKCHQAGGVASQSAKVPTRAGETIAAFSRADGIVEWARELIREGKQKKLSFKAEEIQLQKFEKSLKDAKTQWHAFNLTDSRQTVDEVFRQATVVKDGVWKKLPE
ncbi:MAG: cytochrome c3 family protein [Blastocatellia bacterium]|nr:cytochrome c3 family protein [Blastocatellia bacterium]